MSLVQTSHILAKQQSENSEEETQIILNNESQPQPQSENSEEETQIILNNESQPQSGNSEQETQLILNNQILDYTEFIRNATIIGDLTKKLWENYDKIKHEEKKLIEDFFSTEIARLGTDTFETTYNKEMGLDKSIKYAYKQIKPNYLKKYSAVGGKSKKKKVKEKKLTKRKNTSKRTSNIKYNKV